MRIKKGAPTVNHKHRPKHRPNIRASEDIEYLPEGEISRRYDSLVRLIQGRGFSRDKRQKLEIEACYLWRELETRIARKAAHVLYLKKLNKFNKRNRGVRHG